MNNGPIEPNLHEIFADLIGQHPERLRMSEPTINVTKFGYQVPVSCCMAETCEPGDHPAAPKQPWRRSVRWRLAAWWYDDRPRVHRGPCDHGEDW